MGFTRIELLEDQVTALQETLVSIKAHIKDLTGEGWNDGCGCCSDEDLDDDPNFKEIIQLLAGVRDEDENQHGICIGCGKGIIKVGKYWEHADGKTYRHMTLPALTLPGVRDA